VTVRRRHGSTASAVAGTVLRARRRFIRPADFRGPRAAVDRELCRLAAAGELHRVRNGLYWRGSKTMLGMAPPELGDLLEELVGEYTYGWSGFSAANHLGLTTQVPSRVEVAVVGRPPRDLPLVSFVQRAGRRGRSRARLSQSEVAALEVLEAFDDLVDDPDAAVRRLADLVATGALRRDALKVAAASEPPAVQARLQQVLDAVGVPV